MNCNVLVIAGVGSSEVVLNDSVFVLLPFLMLVTLALSYD